MSEIVENNEQAPVNKWMALMVLLVALLLLGGGVTGALLLAGGTSDHAVTGASLGDPMRGRQVVLKYGCTQCHTDDGTRLIGPSFRGLFNSTVTYIDGTTGPIDEADVRLALREPAAKVIDGFDPQMKPYPNITNDETVNLLAYLRSIGARNPE